MRLVLFPLLLFAAALIPTDAGLSQIEKLKEAKDKVAVESLKQHVKEGELRETLKRLADGSANLHNLPTEDLLYISEKCLETVRWRIESGQVVEVAETLVKKPEKAKKVQKVETIVTDEDAECNEDNLSETVEQVEVDDAVAEVQEDVIDELAAKAKELKSAPTEDLLMHAEIILEDLESTAWRDVGKWPLHEITFLKNIEEDKIPLTCQLADITYDCITDLSHSARGAMTDTRHKLQGVIGNYVYAIKQRLECQSDYEYEIAAEKGEEEPTLLPLDSLYNLKEHCEELPEIITVGSREESTKDGEMTVFGPARFAGYEGYEFEMWLASANGDDSPKDGSSEKEGVTVVIGSAENNYMTALYALDRVLIHRETVLIKHHPLRSYLSDPYHVILRSLIRDGYIKQIVDNDIPTRTKFLSHPSVARVHVAGSRESTADVIDQLASSQPSLSSEDIEIMVTNEDASVNPVIVSPGEYTEGEMKRLIDLTMMSKKLYGGCDAGASQVVVIPQDWSQKELFKEKLRAGLQNYPPSPSYCSGAMERKNALFETYKSLGDDRAGIITPQNEGLPIDQHAVLVDCGTFGEANFDGTALRTPVNSLAIALVELPGGESTSGWLLDTAIPFVNDDDVLYGSVSALLVAPESQPKNVTSAAVASLHYGAIAVNAPPSLALPYLPGNGGVSGSYPASKPSQGFIGNPFGFSNPVKAVLYGPPLEGNPMQSQRHMNM